MRVRADGSAIDAWIIGLVDPLGSRTPGARRPPHLHRGAVDATLANPAAARFIRALSSRSCILPQAGKERRSNDADDKSTRPEHAAAQIFERIDADERT